MYVILLLVICNTAFGQKTIKEAREYMMGFQVGLGYHQSTFVNPQFAKVIENGNLSREIGAVFSTRFTYLPIIIDFNWFSSNFKASSDINFEWNYPDTALIRHRGLELSVSVPLIPTSKNFVPYAGIGYQSSALGIGVEFVRYNQEELEITA